jgi:homogentisate 1,2-dioxygenase
MVGANGLANPRDFLSPMAWFQDPKGNKHDKWHIVMSALYDPFTTCETPYI